MFVLSALWSVSFLQWLSIRLHIMGVVTLATLCIASMALKEYVNTGLASVGFFYCAYQVCSRALGRRWA